MPGDERNKYIEETSPLDPSSYRHSNVDMTPEAGTATLGLPWDKHKDQKPHMEEG